MCKVLMVIGAKDSQKLLDFAKASVGPMSLGNTDGLGYTAIKSDGNIFTERWLTNNQAFKERKTTNDREVEKYLKLILKDSLPEYSIQGDADWSSVSSLLLHTRYATSAKGFMNTHPFVDNDNKTSIIHNGVINNHLTFDKLNSTCDSEIILTEYMKRGLENNPTAIPELCADMSGYWAVGATSVNSKGKRIIDVFKDGAQLSMTYVDQLGAVVFCTSSYTLADILKELKWEHNNTVYEVKNDVAVRFDAISGKVLKVQEYSAPSKSFPNYGNSFNTNKTPQTQRSSKSKKELQQTTTVSNFTSDFYENGQDELYITKKSLPNKGGELLQLSDSSGTPTVLSGAEYKIIKDFESKLIEEDKEAFNELPLRDQLFVASGSTK